MSLQDALDVEEERALGRTIEAVRLVECVLLCNASDGEGLAGKSGQQHVMFRNRFRADRTYVTGDFMPVHPKIFRIGPATERVDLTGENAGPTGGLKRKSQSTYPGKQVNKPKAPGRRHCDLREAQVLLDSRPSHRRLKVSKLNRAYRGLSPGTAGQKFKITIFARTHAAMLDQNVNKNKSRTPSLRPAPSPTRSSAGGPPPAALRGR